MRQLIAVLIVGSVVAGLLALFSKTDSRDDDLARSISQMVETSR